MNPYDRYWKLITSFHAMEHCPNLKHKGGPDHWLEAMWVWLNDTQDPHMDAGVSYVVSFLLNVWRTGGTGRVPWPPFDVFRALKAWDDGHRRAFAQWCQTPVRP